MLGKLVSKVVKLSYLVGCASLCFSMNTALASNSVACPTVENLQSSLSSMFKRNIVVQSVQPDMDIPGLCEVNFLMGNGTNRVVKAYISPSNSNVIIMGSKLGHTVKDTSDTRSFSAVAPEVIRQIKGYAFKVFGTGQKEVVGMFPLSCDNTCKAIYDEAVKLASNSNTLKLFIVSVPLKEGEDTSLVQLYCEKFGVPKGVFCNEGRTSVEMVKKIFATMNLREKLPVFIDDKGSVIPILQPGNVSSVLSRLAI